MNRRGAGIALIALGVWIYIALGKASVSDSAPEAIAALLAMAGAYYLYLAETEKSIP
jgi:threonine/homoserine/homoserine lactone efflux protein